MRCVSRKSNRKLYSYGSNEPLTTAGEFETELCYKDKCCHVCFIVVEEKARAILSRETSEELAILKLEINIYLFIYLPTFLDTGLPRGNRHEWDSGPM